LNTILLLKAQFRDYVEMSKLEAMKSHDTKPGETDIYVTCSKAGSRVLSRDCKITAVILST